MPRPSHENASTAIGVVPFAAKSSSTIFSPFLKSFSAIASRTKLTIVFGGGGAAAGCAAVCAPAAVATNRDKIRAEVVRFMEPSILYSCRMRRALPFLLVVIFALSTTSDPSAQSRPIRGFPDDAVGAQRQREEQFRKIPESARLKEYMEAMAGDPHVAG